MGIQAKAGALLLFPSMARARCECAKPPLPKKSHSNAHFKIRFHDLLHPQLAGTLQQQGQFFVLAVQVSVDGFRHGIRTRFVVRDRCKYTLLQWFLRIVGDFPLRLCVSVFLKGLGIMRRKVLDLVQFSRYLHDITQGQCSLIFQNI